MEQDTLAVYSLLFLSMGSNWDTHKIWGHSALDLYFFP